MNNLKINVLKKCFITVISISSIILSADLFASAYGTSGSPAISKDAYNTGIYVEAAVSYMTTHYTTKLGWFNNGTRGDATFAYGGDLGYQLGKNFAIEAGGFSALNATQPLAPATVIGQFVGYRNVDWWAAYAAGRLILPIYTDVNVYAKLGVAYQHYHLSNNLAGSGYQTNTGQYHPMFALGFQYRVTQHISFNLDYTHFMGSRTFVPQTKFGVGNNSGKFSNNPNLFSGEVSFLL